MLFILQFIFLFVWFYLIWNATNTRLKLVLWIAYIAYMSFILHRAYVSYSNEYNNAEKECQAKYGIKSSISTNAPPDFSTKNSTTDTPADTPTDAPTDTPTTYLSPTSPNYNIERNMTCFPPYKQPKWSILDAVPPPDPFHEYREDGFNHDQLYIEDQKITDYDRWAAVWKPDSDYSINNLDLRNDFLL